MTDWIAIENVVIKLDPFLERAAELKPGAVHSDEISELMANVQAGTQLLADAIGDEDEPALLSMQLAAWGLNSLASEARRTRQTGAFIRGAAEPIAALRSFWDRLDEQAT